MINAIPTTAREALATMQRLRLEPYWENAMRRTLFRKRRGVRGYRVTRQAKEKVWPLLIELLGLHTPGDVMRVRRLLSEAQHDGSTTLR